MEDFVSSFVSPKIRSQELKKSFPINYTSVILWSVVFAPVIADIEWRYALISLAITIVFTVIVVLLAFNLPPLNGKGFIFFGTISGLLAVLAIVASISDSLTGRKITVLCILTAVSTALVTLTNKR
uniref:Uncharacterized protein n=1 Tax=Trichobilharzia regenti TaxID=157069 RepID=A0AA85JCC1_TRIRE|nr:unnamed protein product [Trichobilharzia regenti]